MRRENQRQVLRQLRGRSHRQTEVLHLRHHGQHRHKILPRVRRQNGRRQTEMPAMRQRIRNSSQVLRRLRPQNELTLQQLNLFPCCHPERSVRSTRSRRTLSHHDRLPPEGLFSLAQGRQTLGTPPVPSMPGGHFSFRTHALG